jgi:anti-sigma factor RsiW
MKLEDDTLLTAYLDGELSQSDRRAVEAALKSNPRLVAQLRELAVVRGLVAGLSRPGTPYDMVGPVMARVTRRPWVRLASVRRAEVAMGSGLAAAAALLVGIFFWPNPHSGRLLDHHALVAANREGNPRVPVAVAPVDARVLAEIAGSPPTADHSLKADPKPSAALVAAGPDQREVESDRQRQRFLKLLDGKVRRRIVLTAETLEQGALAVQQLLSDTPRTRPNFARMPVNKRLEIDPREPGEAVLFVLLMDESELRYLCKELESNLHLSLRDEGVADRAVTTMLADMGRVDALEGHRADKLISPPPDLGNHSAFKEAIGKKDNLVIHDDLPPGTKPDLRPRGDSPQNGSNSTDSHAATRTSEPPKTSTSQPDRLMTVLIWVKARDAHGR